MKKTLTIFAICLLTSSLSFSQDSIRYWTRSLSTGLNFNQASFSDNWAGGGINSIALGAFLNAKANFKKNKIGWDNEMQLAYGMVQNQDEHLKKATDKIFIDTKLGYAISKHWNLFASMNFTTQFADGYKYLKPEQIGEDTLISRFMAPGYLISSVGFEYKPVDYFWIRLGTGTLRQTFVTDKNLYKTVPNNYGVKVGETMKNEIAFQVIASFDRDIMKNVNLKARAMALAPYDNMGKILSQLDLTLRAKVNRFINVSLSGVILNDVDQAPDVQYSQGFALGIMYMFTEFK